MSLVALAIALLFTWMLLAFGGWLAFQLFQQHGRLLLRLEQLERQDGQQNIVPAAAVAAPSGLPVGTAAPSFQLPNLRGGRTALQDFLGRQVLLIFFNPSCGYCRQMAADLARLPAEGEAGHPIPLVVSTGSAESNQQLVEQFGLRCPVLLQEQMEVASTYGVRGTPMGYLLDERGVVLRGLATGAKAVFALTDPLPGAEAGESAAPASPPTPGPLPSTVSSTPQRGNRPLSESRIGRNGLPAGTPAPLFRLPRLDGGELSLEEYRGRKVLLLFSDPHCGPCQQLSPQVEALHRARPDVAILMISRGDPEENRRKVAEQGLTFPVLLQRQWEISRLYAMFATPIAYLIDEEGVLASDVAAGAEAILGLLASAQTAPSRSAPEPRCRCRGNEAAMLGSAA